MRILLVIPSREAGFTKFPDEVLSIAGMLEKHGHQVRVHDSNLEDRHPGDFLSFKPDMVGFAVATGPNITDSMAKSIEFKKILPDVKIVWGFRHPSALPRETLVEPYVDYVVIGAGEYTLLELAQHLETGNPKLAEIKGLAYKQNGRVFINQHRPFLKNLDELPDPAWHLIDARKYWDVAVNVSRGCSYSCTFCSDASFHKGITNMSAERIVSQMEQLKNKHGINLIYLSGDNFFLDRQRIHQLCHHLIEKKLKVEWNCDIAGPLDDEDAALMAKAGCTTAIMGVESGSQRMLDFLLKGNVKEIERTFWTLVKHKIIPTLFLMYAYPTETAEDFQMTLDLIKRLDNPPYLLMKFVPYPQTALFDYCVKESIIDSPPQCLNDWAEFPVLYYANEVNLSQVPQAAIDIAIDNYKKTYSVNRFRFTLKHKPVYFLKAMRHPVDFFKALRNLARHQLTRKEDEGSRVNLRQEKLETPLPPYQNA